MFGAGLDAAGDWGLSFRQRQDLLFFWVEQGACCLLREGHAPLEMQQGDFALIYTAAPFTLASSAEAAAVDSELAVAAAGRARLALGSGSSRAVTLHAGKFLVDRANAHLLHGLLPPLVHIDAGDVSLRRVRALLSMNETEARDPGPASTYIIERLLELVLVELLRIPRLQAGEKHTGLLAGLADPVIRPAIVAMHQDVARDWTVAALANMCAVSRSTFAVRFQAMVGAAPIAYLIAWRMALAKDALRHGTQSIGEIAFAVGFQSASAFTTAFTRAVGCSPGRFAHSTHAPQRPAPPFHSGLKTA